MNPDPWMRGASQSGVAVPSAAAEPEDTAGPDRLLRAFPAKPFAIEAARNAHVEASDGTRYLDLGGASHGVALIGHNHPAVAEAVREATARALHVAHTFPNEDRTAFLESLHGRLPPELTRTFLANSGTEAVECALKLAVAARPGRSRVVAAKGGFHGRSLGALSVTGRAAFREPFRPLLFEPAWVPFDNTDALDEAIGNDTAAVILEPIQGEGGVHPASRAYLQAARDLCDDRGALLILDEVQTGLGRTGNFLAAEDAGIVPDLVTLGKGLAGGLPVGACSVTDAVADALPPGGHGSTYGGAPLVCAAGRAVLDVLSPDLVSSAARGGRIGEALREAGHPAIKEVRGRGMMLAVELRIRSAPVLQALQDRRVLALPAGPRGIRFLPPLTIDDADLEGAAYTLLEALDACT